MDIVTYALLNKKMAAVASGITIKGSVSSVSDLPSGASVGDEYFVDGVPYVWDGDNWIQLKSGGASVEAITAAEIDELWP